MLTNQRNTARETRQERYTQQDAQYINNEEYRGCRAYLYGPLLGVWPSPDLLSARYLRVMQKRVIEKVNPPAEMVLRTLIPRYPADLVTKRFSRNRDPRRIAQSLRRRIPMPKSVSRGFSLQYTNTRREIDEMTWSRRWPPE